jgi:4-hydroxy-2-oxoglutarate aldolase
VPLFEGIFPPIPTPFDARGAFAADALTANLRWWSGFDLTGIVVLGSNGEAALLDEDERLEVVAVARAHTPDNRVVIAGTGAQSTRATIRLTQSAAATGADAALVLPPFYYKGQMTRDVLVRHFRAVADASPIPLILYNMPACTGIDLDAETVASLAEHENVVGLKDSSGSLAKLGDIRRRTTDDFSVLAGSAGFLLPALALGATGGVLALANIAPAACIEILRLAREGAWERAREIQLRLIPPNIAVTRRWGVPGLKAAMDRLGLYGGPVRAPLLPLPTAEHVELERILIDAGIQDSHEEATR